MAITLAQTHGAHLTGLYIAADPMPPGNIRAEIPAQFLAVLKDQLTERIEAAEACFIEVVERAGLSVECRTAHCPGTCIAELIGQHTCYADMVVLGLHPSEKTLIILKHRNSSAYLDPDQGAGAWLNPISGRWIHIFLPNTTSGSRAIPVPRRPPISGQR